MRIKIKKTGSYNSSKKYIDLIEKASVYDIAINSPITFAPNISQKEKNKIYLKREDLQPVFSFKNRGAYNKIVNLTPKQKDAGVIAASAGNHAQGVAVSCKKLKINCLIVILNYLLVIYKKQTTKNNKTRVDRRPQAFFPAKNSFKIQKAPKKAVNLVGI